MSTEVSQERLGKKSTGEGSLLYLKAEGARKGGDLFL